jgi:hypothetical protein
MKFGASIRPLEATLLHNHTMVFIQKPGVGTTLIFMILDASIRSLKATLLHIYTTVVMQKSELGTTPSSFDVVS